MGKTLSIAGIIGALAMVMASFDANAIPISRLSVESPDVALAAGGCGPGFHRGPYGACRPNVVPYGAVGVYRGGVYRGGVYRGGVYRGGVYRGGVYRGGVYRGGAYRGGAYHYHRGVHRGGRVYRR